jgi:hypothetical protein
LADGRPALGMREIDKFRGRMDADDAQIACTNFGPGNDERQQSNSKTGKRRVRDHIAVVDPKPHPRANDLNAFCSRERPVGHASAGVENTLVRIECKSAPGSICCK